MLRGAEWYRWQSGYRVGLSLGCYSKYSVIQGQPWLKMSRNNSLVLDFGFGMTPIGLWSKSLVPGKAEFRGQAFVR